MSPHDSQFSTLVAAGKPIRSLEDFAARGRAAQLAVDEVLPSPRSRALNATRFLCRSEVRKFLLEYARANRTHKFSRVSEETLVEINEAVRALLVGKVRRLPSKGKTI